jgi:hypothetical protein
MPRSKVTPETKESGQALPLFALMIFVLLGFVAMSIDVGRFVWARTSMQAGVDAAALAAAQSMPIQADAEAKAAEYWLDNSGFIQSQGTNVNFTVSYPPGNKRIRVSGEADIPTWFARFFGVDNWHVSAEGDAEAQVLDIAVVLDISGSMCYDPPMLHIEEDDESQLMSPGRGASKPLLVDGDLNTAGPQAMPSTGNNTGVVIELSTVAGISTSSPTNRILMHSTTNGTGSYEILLVTNVNSAQKRVTVTRAQSSNFPDPNVSTSKISHPIGAEVWLNRTACDQAARSSTAPYGVNPFDGTIAAAEYFTTLFNAGYDKIGVAKYSTNSASVSSLSSNLSGIKSSIHSFAPPSGSTNIAGGLAGGRIVLDGAGKRANAVRVLVLLTDGIANMVCGNDANDNYATTDYNSLPCGSTSSATTAKAQGHAYSEAIRAKNADIIIFTIGLGNDVDAAFLKQIADGGVAGVGPCQQNDDGCRFYFAPTTAQLDEAFEAIAEQTHIALVR